MAFPEDKARAQSLACTAGTIAAAFMIGARWMYDWFAIKIAALELMIDEMRMERDQHIQLIKVANEIIGPNERWEHAKTEAEIV